MRNRALPLALAVITLVPVLVPSGAMAANATLLPNVMPRGLVAMTAFDGASRVYILGGFDGGSRRAEILALDVMSGVVTDTGARLPSGRSHGGAVWYAGSAYVLGGDVGGSGTDQIVRYTPATGAVSVLPLRLPTPVMNAAFVHDGNGNVYVIGGQSAAPYSSYLATVVKVDLNAGTASVQPSLQLPRARSMVTGVWDPVTRTAYVLGGLAPFPDCFLRDVVAVNPAAGTSTVVASLPASGTSAPCGGVFMSTAAFDPYDRNVYLFGGYFGSYCAYAYQPKIQRFNVDTRQTAVEGATPRGAASGSAQSVGDGRILVVGGEDCGSYLNTVYDFRSTGRRPSLTALSTATPRLGGAAGQTVQFTLQLRNTQAASATAAVVTTRPVGWTVTASPDGSYSLAAGATRDLTLAVRVPPGTPEGTVGTFRVTATLGGASTSVHLQAVTTERAVLVTPAASTESGTLHVSALLHDRARGAPVTGAAAVTFSVPGTGLSGVPMTLDPASGRYFGSASLAGLPAATRLDAIVRAALGDGTDGEARIAFVTPGPETLVFGRVTDAAGAPVADARVRLIADRGFPLADAFLPRVARETRTDADGNYLLLAGAVADACARCRVRVDKNGHPSMETIGFSLEVGAADVRRDVVLGGRASDLFRDAITDVARNVEVAVQKDEIALYEGVRAQDAKEAAAEGIPGRLAHQREVAETFREKAMLGLEAYKEAKDAGEAKASFDVLDDPTASASVKRGAIQDLKPLIQKRLAKAAQDGALQAIQIMVDGAAQDSKKQAEEMHALYEQATLDPLVRELEISSGFLLQGESPLTLSDLQARTDASVALVQGDSGAAEYGLIANSPLSTHRKSEIRASIDRFDENAGFFVSADLDKSALLTDLGRLSRALETYSEADASSPASVRPLPWLDDSLTAGAEVRFALRPNAQAHAMLLAEHDTVLADTLSRNAGVAGAGALSALIVGGATLIACSTPVCVVLLAAGGGVNQMQVDYEAAHLEKAALYPLTRARGATWTMTRDWRDANLYGPVLVKSAVDTVLRESATPDVYDPRKHLRVEWVDENGQTVGSPVASLVDNRVHLPNVLPGEFAFSRGPVAYVRARNPSTMEGPGGPTPIPVDLEVTTTTSVRHGAGILGGSCSADLPFVTHPITTRVRLEARPGIQTIEVPYSVLAANVDPCLPPGAAGPLANMVDLQVRVGKESSSTRFAVAPIVTPCTYSLLDPTCDALNRPAFPSVGAGDGAGGDASGPATLGLPAPLPGALLARAFLDEGTPSVSASFTAAPDTGVVRFSVDGPDTSQLALVVRDAAGAQAGWLTDVRADGAEFPATVRRLSPALVEVEVPNAGGKPFTVEARLLASSTAGSSVRLFAEETPARPATLAATGTATAYVGGRSNIAEVRIDVREVGLSAPLADARVQLTLPGLAAVSPMNVPLGAILSGGRQSAVFQLGADVAPNGRYTGVARVTARAPGGATLSVDVPVAVVVDRTPPVVSLVAASGPATTVGGALAVTPETQLGIVATDALSGVASRSVSVDGAAREDATRTFSLAGREGPRAVTARVVDRAGNEALLTRAVMVDRTLPTVTLLSPVAASATLPGASAGGDADGDGVADRIEVESASDPRDPLSLPWTTSVAQDGGFVSGLAQWAASGDLALRATTDDSPLPLPSPLAGAAPDARTLALWGVTSARRAPAAPGAPAVPAPVPAAAAERGALAFSGYGATGTIAQWYGSVGAPIEGFAGVTLDALALEPGATVAAVARVQDAAGRAQALRSAPVPIPANAWTRVPIPLATFGTDAASLAGALLLGVEIEIATPGRPATPRGAITADGGEVRIDNVRVWVPGVDRARVLLAADYLQASVVPAGDVAFQGTAAQTQWNQVRTNVGAVLGLTPGLLAYALATSDGPRRMAEDQARALVAGVIATALERVPAPPEPPATPQLPETPPLPGPPPAPPTVDLVRGWIAAGDVGAPLAPAALAAFEATVAAMIAPLPPPPQPSAPPAPRAVVAGLVPVESSAVDPSVEGAAAGLAAQWFELDGAPVLQGARGTIDFGNVASGIHVLAAVARDALGHEARAELEVLVAPTSPVGVLAAAAQAADAATAVATAVAGAAAPLADPDGLAAYASAVASPAGALADAAPGHAQATRVVLVVPDASRVEMRDADGDGAPRAWVGVYRVTITPDGATTEDLGMVDSGVGDAD